MEMEMEASSLIWILTEIPWKKLNLPPRSTILRDFQFRNNDLYFWSPGHGYENNEEKKIQKDTYNSKELCFHERTIMQLITANNKLCPIIFFLNSWLPSVIHITLCNSGAFFEYKVSQKIDLKVITLFSVGVLSLS